MKVMNEYTFQSKMSEKSFILTLILSVAVSFLSFYNFNELNIISIISLSILSIVLTIPIIAYERLIYSTTLLINDDRIFIKEYFQEPASIYFTDILKIKIKRFSIEISSSSSPKKTFRSSSHSIQSINRIIEKIKVSHSKEYSLSIHKTNDIF
jgi:hypothetical protein